MSSSKHQYPRQAMAAVVAAATSAAATSSPRSILKCSAPQPVPRPPHPCVRFPSSPKLSTVYITHCSKSYDRTPISIGPNSCALPERGSRSYSPCGTPISQAVPQDLSWSNHAHPSALARQPQNQQYLDMGYAGSACDGAGYGYDGGLLPPPLTHDDASSEDSDGVASPPSETDSNPHPAAAAYHRQYVPSQSHLHSDPFSHPPIPQSVSRYPQSSSSPAETDYSLSFLPHASRKRDHHAKPRRASPPATAFNSSWCQSDESSCLGGF